MSEPQIQEGVNVVASVRDLADRLDRREIDAFVGVSLTMPDRDGVDREMLLMMLREGEDEMPAERQYELLLRAETRLRALADACRKIATSLVVPLPNVDPSQLS